MSYLIRKNRRSLGSFVLALLIAMSILGVTPSHGHAEIVLMVQDSTAPAGGNGSFDILLTNTGGTFDLAAFSLQLSTPAGSGIAFTLTNTNTLTAPYLFGTLQALPFSFETFPNVRFVASDTYFASPGFVTSTSGSDFGLAHIDYTVTTGASTGAFTVSLLDTGGATSLSDGNGDAIAFATSNGTISVTPQPNGVPAPPSLIVILTGFGAYSVTWCWAWLNRIKRLSEPVR